jgi:hypothetical protein
LSSQEIRISRRESSLSGFGTVVPLSCTVVPLSCTVRMPQL